MGILLPEDEKLITSLQIHIHKNDQQSLEPLNVVIILRTLSLTSIKNLSHKFRLNPTRHNRQHFIHSILRMQQFRIRQGKLRYFRCTLTHACFKCMNCLSNC